MCPQVLCNGEAGKGCWSSKTRLGDYHLSHRYVLLCQEQYEPQPQNPVGS